MHPMRHGSAKKIYMKTDILLAHPFKHHAFNMAAGCAKSGRDFKAVFPLYNKGLGRLVKYLPGVIGRKASLYSHNDLDDVLVISPFFLQIRKLISFLGDPGDFQFYFDEYVSKKIISGKWQANVLIALQDHMPKTIYAAKNAGWKIWSDQINFSYEASGRIRERRLINNDPRPIRDESDNLEILSVADVITAPSSYALKKISSLSGKAKNIHIVPYGVDSGRFFPAKQKNTKTQFFVRSNTLEKGGDLFLKALSECGSSVISILEIEALDVFILGELDKSLINLMNSLGFDSRINIVSSPLPSLDVPEYMRKSALFIMPSCSESMSLACIEAMQTGLPMLVSKYVGLDSFNDYQIGVEVDLTVESIVEGILFMCNKKDMWPLWSKNSLKYANNLSWESYEDNISRIAKSV